jgi:aryl-alcohol dehydrogenase-like predicted oxidoreductase
MLMQYARLGNTGLIISRLSLGTMTFGSDPAMPNIYKVSQDNARAMVEKSLEAGINFFDTADGYASGQSETMLGELLKKRRHDVVLATKVGFRTGNALTQAGLSRRHILASCDMSLKRLNTDYVDLYIVHKEDPYTPLEETLSALNELVRAGKVRYLGFSNWAAWKAAAALQIQKANGWAHFTSGQMYYSLVGRDVEQDVVPFLRAAGLSMNVWSPLAGGFLSGKYTEGNLKDEENRLSGFDFLPIDKESGFKVIERMREIAKAHEASVAQVALAWLLSKSVVSSIIVGASKLHQLEDNLRAVEVKLSEAEVSELDAMTAPTPLYPHWFNINLVDAKHKEILGA